MNMLVLEFKCDASISSVDKIDARLKIALAGIDEDELIDEILDNVSIEKILKNIDPIALVKEIDRKIEEKKCS